MEILKKMKSKGMTLVEIIVAIGFLGIVMIPVINQITFIVMTNVDSQEKLIQSNLCQAYIEQLISSESPNVNLLLSNEDYSDVYVFFSIERSESQNSANYLKRKNDMFTGLNNKVQIFDLDDSRIFNQNEAFFIIKYDSVTSEHLIKSGNTLLQLNSASYEVYGEELIQVVYPNQWLLYDITVKVDDDDDFSDAKMEMKTSFYVD